MDLQPSTGALVAELRRRLDNLGDATEKGGDDGLQEVAAAARAELRRRSNLPHSGPIYGGKSRYPASLPGESPARQSTSDGLYDSYEAWVEDGVLSIGSDDVKAALLEFGGDTGRNHATHIEPRPLLQPTVDLAAVAMRGAVSKGIEVRQRRVG